MSDTTDGKKIARNTLMLYLRMFVILGVTLYTSRVVLEQLGIIDYGVYNVVGGIVTMLGFLNGSMTAATQRFLAVSVAHEDKNEVNIVFGTAKSLHIIISGIVFLLAETIGLWFLYNYINIPDGKFNAAFWVYQCSIGTAIISLITVPFTSISIANEKMGIYAYLSFLEAFLKLGVAFLLILMPSEKLELYALLVLISAIVTLSVWIFYTLRTYPYLKLRWIFKKSIARDISGFISWQTLGSLSWIGRTQGVNIVLNMFFGPALNAARGVAVQVNSALSQFVQNFQLAVVPQINKHYALGNKEEMVALVMKSSKISFLLMFVLALPILLETGPILSVWLKVVPNYGVVFVQLMILTSLTDFMSGTVGHAALATGNIKYYWITISSIFLLDLPIVYMAFWMHCKPETMFYIEMCLNGVCLLLRLIFVRKLIGLSVRNFLISITLREVFVILLSVLIAGSVKIALPHNLYGILGVMVFSLLIACAISFFIGLNSNERNWAISIVKERLGISKFHRL